MKVLKGDGLNEIAEVPLRLAGQQVDGVAEIETWLQTQVEPPFALRWRPSGGWRVPVRNTAQLTDCVSALPGLAAWGVLEREGGSPWAQAMCVEGGYVVEVSGHDWAQRVTPIGSLGPDGPRTESRNPDRGREPHGTSFLEGRTSRPRRAPPRSCGAGCVAASCRPVTSCAMFFTVASDGRTGDGESRPMYHV